MLERYLINKIMVYEKLNAFGGKLILESNLHIQDCSQITRDNMFYAGCISRVVQN